MLKRMLHQRVFKRIPCAENDDFADLNVGDVVKVDIFQEGEKVDVTGTEVEKRFPRSY